MLANLLYINVSVMYIELPISEKNAFCFFADTRLAPKWKWWNVEQSIFVSCKATLRRFPKHWLASSASNIIESPKVYSDFIAIRTRFVRFRLFMYSPFSYIWFEGWCAHSDIPRLASACSIFLLFSTLSRREMKMFLFIFSSVEFFFERGNTKLPGVKK